MADLERWPSWNPDVKTMSVGGPVADGTTFRWKAGAGIITSTFRSVDRPGEVGWTGKTLRIVAVHVWRFESKNGSTVAPTVDSWAGRLPRLFRDKSTPPSPACERAAGSSSARWRTTKTSIGSCYVRGPEGIIVELAEQIG